MQYDIAYTRFAQIVTFIYDSGHYILFDLSYWWWLVVLAVHLIFDFVSRQMFVYETHVGGRLGSGPLYIVKYPKENVNPVAALIVSFMDMILDWVFIVLSIFFALRLIIAGFDWLFSPVIV